VQVAYGVVPRVFLVLVFGWPVVAAVLHQRRASAGVRSVAEAPSSVDGAELH